MTGSLPRKLRVIFGVEYALMTTYRAEIVLWAVATALPLIMLGVWSEAGRAGGFPMGAAEMARYFIAVFIVRQFTVCWVIHHFEWQVVSGRLSPVLLRPIDPSWGYVVAHFAEQACRLPVVLALVGLCLWLFPQALAGDASTGPWRPPVGHVLLGVVAVYAAFFCRYAIQYTFSLLAFWIERVGSAHDLVFLPMVFLSGMVAPLEVFPEAVRRVVLWTPYPWMMWFPAKLFMGHEVPVARGLLTLLGWTAALWCVNRWLWRRGLRHYSAMGA